MFTNLCTCFKTCAEFVNSLCDHNALWTKQVDCILLLGNMIAILFLCLVFSRVKVECREMISARSHDHRLYDSKLALAPDEAAMRVLTIFLTIVACCVGFVALSLISFLFCRAFFGGTFTTICVFLPLLMFLLVLTIREYLAGVTHNHVTVCCLRKA